jgi:SPP1 family predicted phage head-tail adaptor
MDEGMMQHNCVYSNRYYARVIAKRSIVVFLRKEENTSFVTIEFDYETFEVSQALGKYNRRIAIYSITKGKDAAGFPTEVETMVLNAYAEVKTTKGFTLIANNTDFEKALTRFTIRYPQTVITYDMVIKYRGKTYTIEYINNVDEANEELELQAKEVVNVGKV